MIDTVISFVESLTKHNLVAIILLASVVNMTQTIVSVGGSHFAWTISCGVVSVFFTLLIVLLSMAQGNLADNLHKPVSLFLAMWWSIGVGTMTFGAPYGGSSNLICGSTGNGWFSAWIAFLFSWIYAYRCSEMVRDMGGKISEVYSEIAAPSSPSHSSSHQSQHYSQRSAHEGQYAPSAPPSQRGTGYNEYDQNERSTYSTLSEEPGSPIH